MLSRRLCAFAAALVTLGACQAEVDGADAGRASGDGGTAVSATTSPSPPGVYGAPIDPSTPDPTEVATDAPVTVAPNSDGGLPVVLTFADWNSTTGAVEVDGYVPTIVESGGTCTLTLTRDGGTVAVDVPGTPDAATTSCGGAAVPGTRLTPGSWTAVLSYRSATSVGSSEPRDVTVP